MLRHITFEGVTYSDKGKQDRAIEDYNRAIELKPDFADAYNNRGIAYSKKGELEGLPGLASAIVRAIKDLQFGNRAEPGVCSSLLQSWRIMVALRRMGKS